MIAASTAALAALSLAFLTMNVWAAVTDLKRFIIPNWISLVIIGLWVAKQVVLVAAGRFDVVTFGFDFLVAFVALLAGMALFATIGVGAGDVKLLTVSMLFVGHEMALWLVLSMAVFGGLMSIPYWFASKFPTLFMGYAHYMPGAVVATLSQQIAARTEGKSTTNIPMAYGPAITMAAIFIEGVTWFGDGPATFDTTIMLLSKGFYAMFGVPGGV